MSTIITVQDVVEKRVSLDEARQMAIVHKGEVFTYFDEGLTRYVFANEDKTKVVKILMEKNGHDFNKEEVDIYKEASAEVRDKMAATTISGGLIEQEFVEPIKFAGRKLTIPQMMFARSCRNEVGWKGDKLVCFDLDEFMKY